MVAPVTYRDRSLASQRIAPATSSGVPSLPSAVLALYRSIISFCCSAGILCRFSVSMTPSATTLKRMPLEPNSLARDRFRPTMAALVVV